MDINVLVGQMIADGRFRGIVNNPLAQFGTPAKRYFFSEILPERTVEQNAYREDRIRYRTIVANDSTRYSPVQIKNGIISGSFLVELSNSDIGSELTAADYDAFIKLVVAASGDPGNTATMQAVAQLTKWADATISLPLVEKRELQRAQALCDAQVLRVGDNGFTELIQLSDPAGHRVQTGIGDWDNVAYPIYDDIMAGVELLASKGFQTARMITTTKNRARMSKNTDMKERAGKIVVESDGSLRSRGSGASLEQINALFVGEGLPPMEINDTPYHTQDASGFFMPRTDFLLLAATDNTEAIQTGDTDDESETLIMENTLGYTAIGRAAGQSEPGVKILVTPFENKPPRVEGEGWQTSFPVPTEPEGVFRIRAR